MLLLGVGNRMRGDDGVGPAVADGVAELGIEGLEIGTETDPLGLLERLLRPAGHAHVVVVDATAPRGRPGRLHVVEVSDDPLAARSSPVGTHGLGLAQVVELARALDLLPPRLTVVGVEAMSWGLGQGLSDPVRDRLAVVVCLTAGLRGEGSDRAWSRPRARCGWSPGGCPG